MRRQECDVFDRRLLQDMVLEVVVYTGWCFLILCPITPFTKRLRLTFGQLALIKLRTTSLTPTVAAFVSFENGKIFDS